MVLELDLHYKNGNNMFKKVAIPLLIIGILLATGFVIYRGFSGKKVEGTADISSKIINRPKDSENTTKFSPNASNSTSAQQKPGNKNSTNTEQPSYQIPNIDYNKDSYLSDIGSILSIPNLSTSTHSDEYWDSLIRQAEEEAQQSNENLRSAEECFDFQIARDNALFPIKQEIANLQIEYSNAESVINEKIKGFDVSESQRIRMIKSEQHRIQSEINQLEAEYNRLYAEWGDCDY